MALKSNRQEPQRRGGFVLRLSLVTLVVLWVVHQQQNSIVRTRSILSSDATSVSDGPALFLRLSGGGWDVWDRNSVLHGDNTTNNECLWTTFRPPTNGNDVSAAACDMCVHKEFDWVSKSIQNKGHWSDCLRLTDMAREVEDSFPVHLEIGANIGACIMQVLLTTNATHIVAFEPVPKNLFALTSTLMRLEKKLRNRVTLFPIAAADMSGRSTIHAAKKNWGNSVVGSPVKDDSGQQFEEPHPIALERVDDLILNTVNVGTMKLDVQGYECKVLQGMPNVLERLSIAYFEVEENFMKATNCTRGELFDLFEGAGMPFIYGRSPKNRIFRDTEKFPNNWVARRNEILQVE